MAECLANVCDVAKHFAIVCPAFRLAATDISRCIWDVRDMETVLRVTMKQLTWVNTIILSEMAWVARGSLKVRHQSIKSNPALAMQVDMSNKMSSIMCCLYIQWSLVWEVEVGFMFYFVVGPHKRVTQTHWKKHNIRFSFVQLTSGYLWGLHFKQRVFIHVYLLFTKLRNVRLCHINCNNFVRHHHYQL